jgi:hypothetical protein
VCSFEVNRHFNGTIRTHRQTRFEPVVGVEPRQIWVIARVLEAAEEVAIKAAAFLGEGEDGLWVQEGDGVGHRGDNRERAKTTTTIRPDGKAAERQPRGEQQRGGGPKIKRQNNSTAQRTRQRKRQITGQHGRQEGHHKRGWLTYIPAY